MYIEKERKERRIKELIYASQSHYGSWCYYNYANFGTQKLFIQLTKSGADYCRVGASIAKPGRSGRSFAFIYLFIYLFIYFTVKWKELNRPQKPDRPQFLEGRFGPCWAVLDNKSQNSFRWYRFGPSYFWNGHTKYHFGPSPQFGPSKVQIRRCRFGPKRGHYTLLLIEIKNKFLWFFFLIHNRLRKKRRHVGSKINFLFVGRWYSFVQIIHIHISPKYGPFSRARNWDTLK